MPWAAGRCCCGCAPLCGLGLQNNALCTTRGRVAAGDLDADQRRGGAIDTAIAQQLRRHAGRRCRVACAPADTRPQHAHGSCYPTAVACRSSSNRACVLVLRAQLQVLEWRASRSRRVSAGAAAPRSRSQMLAHTGRAIRGFVLPPRPCKCVTFCGNTHVHNSYKLSHSACSLRRDIPASIHIHVCCNMSLARSTVNERSHTV